MKLSVLVLSGVFCALGYGTHAAPMSIPKAPMRSGLLQEAHVVCAYLTRDGYCVRPRHAERRHVERRRHYQRQVYRLYEPAPADDYYWRYERPRPVIRVEPDYPPPFYRSWNDDEDWGD
ncbi:MAG: hypothetical protein J0I98_17010 [Mesorhizobium sp.]|nr:hypothetical protein [Mesorhizobium sp.]MBN9244488.1 hypothetical protein [Mesorhizobium sp.]